MTAPRRGEPGTTRRVIKVVGNIAVMVILVLIVARIFGRGQPVPRHPPPFARDTAGGPIEAEENVFRIGAEDLGMAPMASRDAAAHARTLVFFRSLREYPGAPPRIPHGLTAEEFRNQTCNTCHRRGGFVARFGDYARVTPHPGFSQCLQCHLPRDTLVGTPLPTAESQSTCPQCHIDPDETLPVFVGIDWTTTSWPDTGLRALPDAPYLIPHGFQLRTNCLACHAGPEAVMGIRTDHPERANCRQCHIPAHPDLSGLGTEELEPPGSRGGGP